MKLSNVIEGGLAGVSTLTLMQEALHKFDHNAPRPLFRNVRRIKKWKDVKGSKRGKFYIQLAGDLLSNAAFFGLSALGKKKNAVLRGAVLGALAGCGTILLNDDASDNPFSNEMTNESRREKIKDILITLGLYTAGGVIAGVIVKKGKKVKKNFK